MPTMLPVRTYLRVYYAHHATRVVCTAQAIPGWCMADVDNLGGVWPTLITRVVVCTSGYTWVVVCTSGYTRVVYVRHC